MKLKSKHKKLRELIDFNLYQNLIEDKHTHGFKRNQKTC